MLQKDFQFEMMLFHVALNSYRLIFSNTQMMLTYKEKTNLPESFPSAMLNIKKLDGEKVFFQNVRKSLNLIWG